jgi:hypothetical protein
MTGLNARRTTLRRYVMRRMALLVTAAVLALAGCSADSETDAGSSPTLTPATPASTAPQASWTPTGELVYATLPADRGADDVILPVLHTINANGSGGKKLSLSAMGASWSGDGSRMLAWGVPVQPEKIFPWRPVAIDPDGRNPNVFRLPALPDKVSDCRWAPDAKEIVCDVEAGVVRIDPATSKTTILARGGEDQVWDISASGRIVFAHQASNSDGIEDAELWTVNIDGSGLHKLTAYGEVEGTYDNAGGSWVLDGSAIITATPDGKLVKVNATTGELTEIALEKHLFASRPAVSPDGTMVAFEVRSLSQDIYVTRIDGGPVLLITGTADDEIRPDWRPPV